MPIKKTFTWDRDLNWFVIPQIYDLVAGASCVGESFRRIRELVLSLPFNWLCLKALHIRSLHETLVWLLFRLRKLWHHCACSAKRCLNCKNNVHSIFGCFSTHRKREKSLVGVSKCVYFARLNRLVLKANEIFRHPSPACLGEDDAIIELCDNYYWVFADARASRRAVNSKFQASL